jgi:multidrug efflux pump subunit AcrB
VHSPLWEGCSRGIVGLLFREFAVTVAAAIVVSVIVSLTLTPMMCARVLTANSEARSGLLSRTLERCFDRLAALYDRGLVVALRHRFVTLLVMIATVAATLVLFVAIPKGFSHSKTPASSSASPRERKTAPRKR